MTTRHCFEVTIVRDEIRPSDIPRLYRVIADDDQSARALAIAIDEEQHLLRMARDIKDVDTIDDLPPVRYCEIVELNSIDDLS